MHNSNGSTVPEHTYKRKQEAEALLCKTSAVVLSIKISGSLHTHHACSSHSYNSKSKLDPLGHFYIDNKGSIAGFCLGGLTFFL